MGKPDIFPEERFVEWDRVRAVTKPFFEAYFPFVDEQLKGAANILDLAGGDGHSYDVLSPENADRLTTVDVDGDALDRLKARFPDARTIKAPIEDMPIVAGEFDAAISINGFNNQAGDQASFKEIARVLKPGAKLIFLRDLAIDLYGAAMVRYKSQPPSTGYSPVIFPVVNAETGDVDTLEFTAEELIRGLAQSNVIVGSLFSRLKAKMGTNWRKELFKDELKLAETAALGTKLAAQIRIAEREDPRARPGDFIDMSPAFYEITAGSIADDFGGPDFSYSSTMIEVDTVTQEGMTVDGTVIDSMWVDRMVVPHFKKRNSDDDPLKPTRIHGRVALHVAQRK